MIPMDFQAEDFTASQVQHAEAIAEALECCKVLYVVSLSSQGAHLESGSFTVDNSATDALLPRIPGAEPLRCARVVRKRVAPIPGRDDGAAVGGQSVLGVCGRIRSLRRPLDLLRRARPRDLVCLRIANSLRQHLLRSAGLHPLRPREDGNRFSTSAGHGPLSSSLPSNTRSSSTGTAPRAFVNGPLHCSSCCGV